MWNSLFEESSLRFLGNHGPGNTDVSRLTRWPLAPILYTSGVVPPTSKNKRCSSRSPMEPDMLVDLLWLHSTLLYPTWPPVPKYTLMLTHTYTHRAHIATVIQQLSLQQLVPLVILLDLNNALLECPTLRRWEPNKVHLSFSLSLSLTHTNTRIFHPLITCSFVGTDWFGPWSSSTVFSRSSWGRWWVPKPQTCWNLKVAPLVLHNMNVVLFVSVFHWQATIMGPVSITTSHPIKLCQ